MRVNTEINTTFTVRQRTGWQTDRQTDRMFWYKNTINTIYKIKSSQVRQRRSRIIKSSSSVHLSLTNCLSSSAGYRGWRRETHHRHSRCSSARSWTGVRTQQSITTTTTTSPGGTVKKTTSVATSKKTSPRYRRAMIGVVDKSGIHSP